MDYNKPHAFPVWFKALGIAVMLISGGALCILALQAMLP